MQKAELTINELIDRLNQLATREFPLQEVHSFLQESSIRQDELETYVFFALDQYTRNLIHKSEEYELLAICWQSGQEAPVHGHEGEKCWTRVERGKLRFTSYVEISSANSFDLKVLSTHVGGRGYVDGPAEVHKVENPFTEAAVTLHLYSRPYEACDIYDLENHRKERKKLGYFSQYGTRVDKLHRNPDHGRKKHEI